MVLVDLKDQSDRIGRRCGNSNSDRFAGEFTAGLDTGHALTAAEIDNAAGKLLYRLYGQDVAVRVFD